jgi:hypothetical protein
MTRRRALWILGIATLALLLVLALLDRRMQDAGGPGIITFELARTSERAREILADWGADGRSAAKASLWIDYLYLAAYGAFVWLAIGALRDAAARRGMLGFARLGAFAAPLPLVAAACDAVEDAFLLLVLGGHGGSAAPALATAFASVKFACIGVALAYVLGGLLVARGERARA